MLSSMSIINVLFFQSGDRLFASESDVFRRHRRRQIVTYKDGPRAERVKPTKYRRPIFTIAVKLIKYNLSIIALFH